MENKSDLIILIKHSMIEELIKEILNC